MRDTARTREKICDSALRLFVTIGIDGTTTRDIARGAGVSEGLLYRYFKGKEEMAWTLFKENYLAYAAEIKAILEAGGSFAATVEGIVRFICQSFDSEPLRIRYLLLTQHDYLARITAAMGSPARLIETYLAGAIARGDCAVPDAALATSVLAGPTLQTAAAVTHNGLPGPMARWADALVAATLRALARP